MDGASRIHAQVLPVQVKMEDALAEYHANLRDEQAEVALHRPAVKKQWKTKDGTFQVKQKQPVQEDQKKDQMDAVPSRRKPPFRKCFGTCETCMAVGWEDYILEENT